MSQKIHGNKVSYLPFKSKHLFSNLDRLYDDALNYLPKYDNKNTIKSSGNDLYRDFYKRNKISIFVSPLRKFI
jgi:hypothetical protein